MLSVVVTNEKGGVGKTTTAVHLAWFFAEKNLRVLVIDLDAQMNATYVLEAHACSVTADSLFKCPVDGAQFTAQALTVIPGSEDLVDLVILDRSEVLEQFQVNMAALGEHFDIAIIDTPPTFGIINYAALCCATHVIAPMDLQDFAVLGVTKLLDKIQGMTEGPNPDLKFLGLLPSRFRWNSAVQKEHLAALLDSMGDLILPQIVSLRSAYEQATQQKVPVWQLPKSSGKDAADEMLKLLNHISTTIGI